MPARAQQPAATGTSALRPVEEGMYPIRTAILALALAMGLTSPAFAITFSFTPIDVPGSTGTVLQDINNAGDIVGSFSVPPPGPVRQGFLLNGGTITPIYMPGVPRTLFTNINNLGHIVGFFVDNAGVNHGFLLSGGSFTTIDPTGTTGTFANGINDTGQIVGQYTDASGTDHGFLFSGGTFTPIDVPGAQATSSNDINDAGQIVGFFTDASGNNRSYLRNADGSFTFIDAPGATATFVEGGINNLGDIVGDFDNSTGTHGFLLSGGMFTIIDAPGARATFAIGINDLDQIAGLFDPSDPTMHRMGFLATPVPEPSTLFLLAAAFLALIPCGARGARRAGAAIER
jgi:probable HAF family extracellular repeat protein